MDRSWPLWDQEPMQKRCPRHTDVVKTAEGYEGRCAPSSLVAIAPHRAHVQATCSGSSFMSTGQPQSWGGHGRSPSAIHHTASLTEPAAPRSYKGPLPSVRSTSARATPHGLTGSGPLEPVGQPQEALARGDHGPAGHGHRGRKQLGPVGPVHQRPQRAGDPAPFRHAGELGGPQRPIVERVGREAVREVAVELPSVQRDPEPQPERRRRTGRRQRIRMQCTLHLDGSGRSEAVLRSR